MTRPDAEWYAAIVRNRVDQRELGRAEGLIVGILVALAVMVLIKLIGGE